jgi:hypothetical protein
MSKQLGQKVRLLSALGVDADGLNRWVAMSALGGTLSEARWARLALTGDPGKLDGRALEEAIDAYLMVRGALAPEVGLDRG